MDKAMWHYPVPSNSMACGSCDTIPGGFGFTQRFVSSSSSGRRRRRRNYGGAVVVVGGGGGSNCGLSL